MANLYIRKRTYWARVTHNRREIRFSTKCKDKEGALEVLADFLATLTAYVSPEWRRNVIRDSAARSGWIARTHRLMKERAARRGLPCMRQDQLFTLLTKSAGRCEVTGLPIKLQSDVPRDPFRASVDRMDSTRGYTTENCRIVALVVNVSLNAWGEEAVKTMARAIISRELAGHSVDHVQKHSPRSETQVAESSKEMVARERIELSTPGL